MSYRDDAKGLVVRGNLNEGYQFIGPFNSWEEASEWSNLHPAALDDWIVTIQHPDMVNAKETIS